MSGRDVKKRTKTNKPLSRAMTTEDVEAMFSKPEAGTLEALAESLVGSTEDMMQALVDRRKATLTQREVAERCGTTVEKVKEFERYDSDPRLSTIRRYALAVHSSIDIKVHDEEVQR